VKRNAVGGLVLDDGRESLVTSSGALLMNETIRVASLRPALSRALRPWRPARARHDPGKVLLDVAIAVALGGDCLADVAAVRAQHDLFGVVASDPTVSRLFAALAVNAATTDAVVAALRVARAAARERAWSRSRPLAGTPGTRDGGQVIVDIDATVVRAHSDKEGAEATHKMSYGFSPMCAFVDHGEHGTGETLALDLRPGKASPFNSGDHISVLKAALDQLPAVERDQVLVRADAGGASKAFNAPPHRRRIAVLHWVSCSRTCAGRDRDDSRASLGCCARQRRRTSCGCAGRRAHRLDADPGQTHPFAGQVRSPGMAARDAGHRPPVNVPTPAPSYG
jgi:hypothetical protein